MGVRWWRGVMATAGRVVWCGPVPLGCGAGPPWCHWQVGVNLGAHNISCVMWEIYGVVLLVYVCSCSSVTKIVVHSAPHTM